MRSTWAPFVLPSVGLLMIGVLVVDMSTPLGVSIWAFYILPIMVSVWYGSSATVLFTVLLSTALSFIGFFLSPAGVDPRLAFLNRCLGTGLIWFTMLQLVQLKRVNLSLLRERDLSDSLISNLPGIYCLYDEFGRLRRWNSRLETLSGFSKAELEQKHPLDLFVAEDRQLLKDRFGSPALPLTDLLSGVEQVEAESEFISKSGQRTPIQLNGVRTSIDGRGYWHCMGFDISTLKRTENELERMTRLYAALSQINQAIVWTSTQDELFQKVCDVLVEFGGFHMAWIGWHQPETLQLIPVAMAGENSEYIRDIKVYSDERPEGRGPSGLAFRSNQPYVCNDMFNNPITVPWRRELQERGFNSSAAFPIECDHEVCGILSVYSADSAFFQDREVDLLREAAGDISFALDNFARTEARRQAERKLLNEKQFSDSMIESMPGVVYFYDSNGQFLRWNRNFETVSGFSHAEIARMQPFDFFSKEERPALRERIGEVFETGESSIEASFVARDGASTPYYFTGRRVEFEEKTCLVGVGIDISARVLAEDRLVESERKYRELVEHANSIILRWDSEGKICFLNEFGQRFFGYSSDEIVGQHVLGTIVPYTETGGRDLTNLMEEICATPEAFEQSTNENMRRDGERVWIAWTNRIVRHSEKSVVEFLSIGTDVTLRKQAEVALREAELRFHTLFEQTPVGVVVIDVETGRVTECNAQAARQLGYSTKELCQLTMGQIEETLGGDSNRLNIEQILSQGQDEFEGRHRTKSGDIREVLITARVLELTGRRVIHCVFLDITERKRAQEKIRASEARYRTLFEYAPDGILISSPEGYYLDVNSSLCRMLGYAYEQLVGLHASQVVAESEVQHIGPALDSIQQRADYHREWQFRRRDGSVFPAEVIATMMPQGNVLGMIRDITERKVAELEREKRHQAEAADRIKSAFLATMSHELRTPLNSIIGFTGIILQGLAGPLNEEQSKQLNMVRTSARHLLALVNDVLDISKIEAGQLEVALEPFDVPRSIAKVTSVITPLAAKKSLPVHVQVAANLGEAVGDERRFEQIILNLLSNAIKFTDRGEVTLTADRVDDFCSRDTTSPQPAIRVRVSDTGIGIQPADLANLFQPFRQIDSGLSRNHDGTGLGLAICRRLAELMGGEIRAESVWGKGSLFSVTLPLRERE